MKTKFAKPIGPACGALLFAAMATLAVAPAATADDLPTFRAGLWSFKSTFMTQAATKPQTRSITLCTNPGDDIKKKWAALAAESCKFSPITHVGNRYSYQASCEKNGMLLATNAVIVVEGTDSYRVETESRTNSQVRKETLIAKREGACTDAKSRVPQPAPQKQSN